MTRSARHRHTRNARRVANAFPLATLRDVYDSDGAFTPEGARRFAVFAADSLGEVHWPLCAELLNARARRAA